MRDQLGRRVSTSLWHEDARGGKILASLVEQRYILRALDACLSGSAGSGSRRAWGDRATTRKTRVAQCCFQLFLSPRTAKNNESASLICNRIFTSRWGCRWSTRRPLLLLWKSMTSQLIYRYKVPSMIILTSGHKSHHRVSSSVITLFCVFRCVSGRYERVRADQAFVLETRWTLGRPGVSCHPGLGILSSDATVSFPVEEAESKDKLITFAFS